MMKVYLVIDRIDYHGSEPVRVFKTKEAAETFARYREAAGKAIDYSEVVEMTLDD